VDREENQRSDQTRRQTEWRLSFGGSVGTPGRQEPMSWASGLHETLESSAAAAGWGRVATPPGTSALPASGLIDSRNRGVVSPGYD